jgi:hypothetical protein
MSVYNRVNNSASLDFGYILQNQATPGPFTVEVNYRRNDELILPGDSATITINAYVEFMSPTSGLSAGAPVTAQYIHEIQFTLKPPTSILVPVKFNFPKILLIRNYLLN